jgi:chemotaxis protein MotB
MSRKMKCPKPENHERYLITYADLITLLLVFFIVLYAGSQEDSKKFAVLAEGLRSAFHNVSTEGGGGTSAVFTGSGSSNGGGLSPSTADFDSLTAIIQSVAQQRGLADRINVRMEADRIVIGMNSDLLFASGSAQLRPSAGPVLDAVAEALRGRPNEIRIEGHTDNVPINTLEFSSNWELSAARATSVLRRLVDEGKLNPDKLFAAAYGETRPKADNNTAEGRTANRRAEIVILYPQAAVQPQGTPASSGGALPGRAPTKTPTPKRSGGH